MTSAAVMGLIVSPLPAQGRLAAWRGYPGGATAV